MKTIKRFDLEIKPKQTIEIPFNSEILLLGLWGDNPCIWAMIETDQRNMKREIMMTAEGKTIDTFNRTQYLGSFEAKAEVGATMLHVFEAQV